MIAHAGLCSRRTAETWIQEGRVLVNGKEVRELGFKVDPFRDEVVVDGKAISREPLEYWVLHKPKGVVTTMDDPRGRPIARDLIETRARVYPVGRLDIETTGLLVFTNDGELTERLTHPRHGHKKIYHVLVSGYPQDNQLDKLRGGIELEDGMTAPAEVRPLRTTPDGAWLEIVLREGRKRQIRRMMTAIEHPVVHLRRVQVGPVQLGSLKEGQSRRLSDRERKALGIPSDRVNRTDRRPRGSKQRGRGSSRGPGRGAGSGPGRGRRDGPSRPTSGRGRGGPRR